MGDWSILEGGRIETVGANAANSTGTSVTASATANTKGSYSQLTASTPADAAAITVLVNGPNSAADYLVDIAVGAASSEQVICSNLTASSGTGAVTRGATYTFPIPIPAGTRIAARAQSTTASAVIRPLVILHEHTLMTTESLGRAADYGSATGDSGGTSIDPGGTANTKGSWTQITASTTNPMMGFILAFGNQINTARTQGTFLFDVGIGGAGSEQVILADYFMAISAVDDAPDPIASVFIPCNVPAGTRLAVRAQSSVTDATDRLVDVIIYGVD